MSKDMEKAVSQVFKESASQLRHTIIGEFVDTVTTHHENGETTVVEMPMRKNIITVPISTLMAGLIEGTFIGDYSFWAVGTGSQAASPYLTNLVAEYTRKQVTVAFVDANNATSSTPTNRLVMNVSWAKGELGVVTLTEFGLFSGSNAGVVNGGYMMDYVPHAPISMDATLSLSRKIYFTF